MCCLLPVCLLSVCEHVLLFACVSYSREGKKMPVSAFYLTYADSEGVETAERTTGSLCLCLFLSHTHTETPLLSHSSAISSVPPPFQDTLSFISTSFHLQSRLQFPRLCHLYLYCCNCLSVVLLRKQREHYQRRRDSVVLVIVT